MQMSHARRAAFAVAPILALVTVGDISWARPQAAEAPQILELAGDIAPVHDPVAIEEKGTYYMFCTGGRNGQGVIPIRTSKDMRRWTAAGFVFPSLPEWATREIPKARNAWAPDIAFFNGMYHLYYSVSSFGSRDSAIGLATTALPIAIASRTLFCTPRAIRNGHTATAARARYGRTSSTAPVT